MSIIDKASAIKSLHPTSEFVLSNDTDLLWLSDDIAKPTDAEIDAELARLQAEHDGQQYARNRKEEYPPIENYLDAIVKGDEVQKQEYIDACLAVKAKYPKSETQ